MKGQAYRFRRSSWTERSFRRQTELRPPYRVAAA
jgi:hypothetical protein